MENPRFRDIPFDMEVALHFTPDERQLADWLTALSAIAPADAAQKILQATLAFDHLELKTTTKIKFLQQIQRHFQTLVTTLQKSYVDAPLPLSNKAMRDVELVVWNYLQLARALRQCKLKNVSLSTEQQAWLLHTCLELVTFALVHICLSYRQPMHGFWSLCYELYARAEQANLTHIEVTRPGRSSESIATLFKHLLLFYLCDTQQFRGREILTLFECLSRHATTAGILANYQSKWQPVVCVFNLNKDLPPQKVNPNDPRDDLSERFITTVSVAKKLYADLQAQTLGNSALRSINHDVLIRALNTLGLARKRKFSRIAEQAEFTGIVGLTPLIHYLQSQQEEDTVWTLPSIAEPKPVKRVEKTQFDLVPIGGDLSRQMSSAKSHQADRAALLSKLDSVLTKPSVEVKAEDVAASQVTDLCPFDMQDSSAKGYGLITRQPSTQVKIGDVIALLVNGAARIEIGLVRRLNQMPGQHLRLGVEVLGFESELVFVANPYDKTQGFWAILLPGTKSLNQPDTLLYNASLFKQGDKVMLRGKRTQYQAKLHKIIQMTSAVTHMSLLGLAATEDAALDSD